MKYREMTFAFVVVAILAVVLSVTGADEAAMGQKQTDSGHLGLVPQDIGGVEGARVEDVTPYGPAAEAGIRRGDVITSFADQPVESSVDLRRQVAATRPGSKIPVGIHRDGKDIVIKVELRERPDRAT